MSLETRKEKLDYLQKKLKKKKFMALLLALFTLGVNAFAWFVFSARSDFTYDGQVAAWDVELREGQNLVNNFIIAVNMKPGMTDFEKEYTVNNLGGVTARLKYEVTSLSILGTTVDLTGVADPITYLNTFYPFSIDISSDKTIIPSGDDAEFDVVVSWDFEDATAYYRLNEVYTFDNTFTYYQKTGSTYTPFEVTAATFAANRNNLYLEKDDADTYFGMQCGTYQDTSNLSCLVAQITLTIEQYS